MRILGIIAVFILAGTALQTNLYAQSQIGRPLVVGVLYWSMNISGQVLMRQGLEEEADKINQTAKKNGTRELKLIVRVAGDGPEGIENQIKQMYELIDLKPDLLIVQPTDNAALSEALQAANQINLPVIAYDQYISGGRLASYVTSDNYQAGYLDGEYVAASFAKGKMVKVVLVEYPHVSSTVERVNGFLDALHDAGTKVRVLKSYEAVEAVSGKAVGQAILHDFPTPGSIDAVFCVNDGGGTEVAKALQDAGRKEIILASVDGAAPMVNMIRKNSIVRVDTAQFCRMLGQTAMQLAWKYLHGEAIPDQVSIPVFPITQATLPVFRERLEEMPEKFTKPWPCQTPVWQRNLKIIKIR